MNDHMVHVRMRRSFVLFADTKAQWLGRGRVYALHPNYAAVLRACGVVSFPFYPPTGE